ncbi:hypothetical protein [Streptomyces sp. NPDC050485]|uniref:hypothetical protein n=1 Tax=Streptomyces sp. NPDC050485 TaxID=3365617 RepID=UPI0037BB34F1
MTSPACQTYTVIGLRMDCDFCEVLIAGVLPGLVADDLICLATSEDDFTRWAQEFDAPDADTAAAMAYEHCRNDPAWDD